jgi:hypothetical protein
MYTFAKKESARAHRRRTTTDTIMAHQTAPKDQRVKTEPGEPSLKKVVESNPACQKVNLMVKYLCLYGNNYP